MELKPGTVVKSAGGHDQGFFVVLSFDGTNAYIANVKSRLLEKPKKKNPKHLTLTRTAFDLQQLTTDKKLREALWPFNYGGLGEQIVEERDSLG